MVHHCELKLKYSLCVIVIVRICKGRRGSGKNYILEE